MLKKNKNGMWDLYDIGMGEGIYNIVRSELQTLKCEIESEFINEDIKEESCK